MAIENALGARPASSDNLHEPQSRRAVLQNFTEPVAESKRLVLCFGLVASPFRTSGKDDWTRGTVTGGSPRLGSNHRRPHADD